MKYEFSMIESQPGLTGSQKTNKIQKQNLKNIILVFYN